VRPSDSPAPGRRERKKAETRARIFRAALRLVRKRGFDAVTIDDICTAADVAKRTFFLHFPTKDALVREYGTQIRALVTETLLGETGSAESRLRLAVRVMAARARENAEIVQLAVGEAFSGNAAGEVLDEGRTLALDLAEIVRDGQKSGEIRAGIDARIVSGAIVSTYLSLVAEWARFGEPELEPAIEQMLDLVLDGARAARRPKQRRA
jgi:AcrR family transcriptional regulator